MEQYLLTVGTVMSVMFGSVTLVRIIHLPKMQDKTLSPVEGAIVFTAIGLGMVAWAVGGML